MTKINFENLPSTATPLNATNLNQLQTNVENAINDVDSKTVYSTTETVIGEWLGKPLYRKVVNIGNLPNNTYKDVAHNVSNIDEITKVYLIVKSTNDYYFMTNMQGTSSIQSNHTINARANATNIVCSTDTDYSTFTAYGVIEYTKTTDV